MKTLSLDCLDDLATGCSILGSGGGGDPTYYYKMASHEMQNRKPLNLLSFSDLKPEDLIFPIGFTGAPLVQTERIPNGTEFDTMMDLFERYFHQKITAIMPFEIGGGNAFAPLIVAARQNLPILDADLMGRAFPESQMTSWHLMGNFPAAALITDCLGNGVFVEAEDTLKLEKIGRQITVSMGSSGVYGFHPIPGSEARKCTIPKSISRAISIGKAHREAKEKGLEPIHAAINFCGGSSLGSGKIVDIDRTVSKGFLNGSVLIESNRDKMEFCYQNEYLIAKRNGKIVATTPDILVVFEQETGNAVSTDALQYGLRVTLAAIPAPELWKSQEALKLVGPRYFGYELDYKPIDQKNLRDLS